MSLDSRLQQCGGAKLDQEPRSRGNPEQQRGDKKMTVVICSKGGHQKASVTGSESKPHPSPPPPACLLFPSKA